MKPILEVKNLKKYYLISSQNPFQRQKTYVKAVDGVNFTVNYGETLGLVGESGSGKSTTGRLILNLIPPTDGEVFFEGKKITGLSDNEMRPLRSDMQIIFQDTFASLNPRMRAGEIVGEGLDIHKKYKTKAERAQIIEKVFHDVGLSQEQMQRYPHEFSGGQRQRIGIARAISLKPKLIVCDEPVSALDVSIQAQIINMMKHIQREYKLTYIFISHDLKVVKHISDRVMVMYLGRIVEMGSKDDLFDNPRHPYTKALISAIPVIDVGAKKERIILKGEISANSYRQKGCSFYDRCWMATEKCADVPPEYKEITKDHFVACHLY
jgi:oligopeptide transport system ATP-binding protein